MPRTPISKLTLAGCALLVFCILVYSLWRTTPYTFAQLHHPMKKKSSSFRDILRNAADIFLDSDPLAPDQVQLLKKEVSLLSAELRMLKYRIRSEPQAPDIDPLLQRLNVTANDEDRTALQQEHATQQPESHHTFRRSTVPMFPNPILLPPSKREDVEWGTVFVSVASFRDNECSTTVGDLFYKASNPQRIFVGVVEQHDATADKSCLPYFLCPEVYGSAHTFFPLHPSGRRPVGSIVPQPTSSSHFCPVDNVRVRRLLPQEARGPTLGRYLAMLMYQNERYFMMIDSHNRFVPRWDAKCIRMAQLLPTKGVISHYPNVWNENLEISDETESPYFTFMCSAHFMPDWGFVRMDGMATVYSTPIAGEESYIIPSNLMKKKLRKMILQPFTAAGFLFAPAKAIQEVPFDPHLDYLFDGEEILYTVRLWTHGWDSYCPFRHVLYHHYVREKSPKVWSVPNNFWWVGQRKAQKRVQYLLGVTKPNTSVPLIDSKDPDWDFIKKNIEKYGMGTARSLEAYWNFARIDPQKRIFTSQFCDDVRKEV